jgi:dCMP deaminase
MKVGYLMDGEKEKHKNQRYENLYMDLAARVAEMSYARRLHVGAVIVKKSNIISFGWNGMPTGWDNNCEYEDIGFSDAVYGEPQTLINRGLKTRPEVLHAEQNAIAKLAKSTESGDGATMFVTHAPCMDCAKLIYQSGITSLYYRNSYRDESGLNFLRTANVGIHQVSL